MRYLRVESYSGYTYLRGLEGLRRVDMCTPPSMSFMLVTQPEAGGATH